MATRDGLWTVLGIVGLMLSFFICMGDPRVSMATPAPAVAPQVAAPPPAPVPAPAPVAEAPPPVAMRAGPERPVSPPAPVLREALDTLLKGRTIEFQTASAIITPGTEGILDALVPVLQRDRTARIEIAGHTDNTGDADGNQRLSERRAVATLEYLAGKGVDRGRLEARGYGQSQPIADNATEAGRLHNRRIEFNVLAPGGK